MRSPPLVYKELNPILQQCYGRTKEDDLEVIPPESFDNAYIRRSWKMPDLSDCEALANAPCAAIAFLATASPLTN